MRDFVCGSDCQNLNRTESWCCAMAQGCRALRRDCADQPCNAATNREYHGTNIVLLWMAMRDRAWPTAHFVTFKQALELGGHVRKGEHGTRVFVKDLKFAESESKAAKSWRCARCGSPGIHRFNVAQCDGLPAHINKPPIAKPRNHDTRDPLIEEFIATTGAKIREGGNTAAFIPKLDDIVIAVRDIQATPVLITAHYFTSSGIGPGTRRASIAISASALNAKRMPPKN